MKFEIISVFIIIFFESKKVEPKSAEKNSKLIAKFSNYNRKDSKSCKGPIKVVLNLLKWLIK